MKKIIQRIIRLRNPQFEFDPSVDITMIFNLTVHQSRCLLRGIRMMIYNKQFNLIFLERGVRLFHKSKITMGNMVKIGEFTHLSALGKKGIIIGDNVGVGAFCRLIVSTSFNSIGEFIKIGDNVGIGEYAYLGGAGGLEIGNDCIVGQYFSCHPENHQFSDLKTPIRYQGTIRKGIKIGGNCWVGSKVTILDGVTIGEGCVIAAGAVVTQSMPAYSVIAGVPAKVIKDRAQIASVSNAA